MDPACAAPEEGAESGEQPGERLKKPAMETVSEMLNVKPKRQRGRNGNGEKRGETDQTALSCICLQTQRQQQLQQQQQPCESQISVQRMEMTDKHVFAVQTQIDKGSSLEPQVMTCQ